MAPSPKVPILYLVVVVVALSLCPPLASSSSSSSTLHHLVAPRADEQQTVLMSNDSTCEQRFPINTTEYCECESEQSDTVLCKFDCTCDSMGKNCGAEFCQPKVLLIVIIVVAGVISIVCACGCVAGFSWFIRRRRYSRRQLSRHAYYGSDTAPLVN